MNVNCLTRLKDPEAEHGTVKLLLADFQVEKAELKKTVKGRV